MAKRAIKTFPDRFMLNQDTTYDYIVIGSGFGGAVSALRLKQKGYSVLVLEAGRRFEDHDFPKSNRTLRKWLYLPRLGHHGILRMELFRHALFLSGAGVGGGSLGYANTLLHPPDAFFASSAWGNHTNMKSELQPFYELARSMLGVTVAQGIGPADNALLKIAEEMGREHTFHLTDVGVFFGQAGVDVADPYFAGQGPARVGCTLCGNCMIGCRIGAKNTLMKNYLYFAERLGAEIVPETKATKIQPTDSGYEIHAIQGMGLLTAGKKVHFRSKGLILSAGVLGTVRLLLQMKDQGILPKLSNNIGKYVRTNSEALVGFRSRDKVDFSRGIAIGSGFYPDEKTHVELVRYGEKSDMVGILSTLMVSGGPTLVRIAKFLYRVLTEPRDFLRDLKLAGWAKQSIILLVMQTLDNHMSLVLQRRWYWPFKKSLTTEISRKNLVPVYIPMANKVAKLLANKFNGYTLGSVTEIFLNKSSTAHILGGAIMGHDHNTGVISGKNEVFGYKNMYVIDGSMIPANLGVNPSLTITAMAEHAMSHIPEKTSPAQAIAEKAESEIFGTLYST